MTIINIVTNEFAISSHEHPVLHTQYVNTCTVLIGVERESKRAFLCHMNTPLSPCALSELVADLRALGLDPAKFQLYQLGGIHPRFILMSVLLAILGAVFLHPVSAILAVLPMLYSLTRLSLKFQLWRTKVFAAPPLSLGYSTAWFGLGKTKTTVDMSQLDKVPRVESYIRDKHDKHFKNWTDWWVKMRKHKDSA